MRINVKGLGSGTKRLADGTIRYYIRAWRSRKGEGAAPVIAEGDGRTLAAARAAAVAALEKPDARARLDDARGRRPAAIVRDTRYIAGVASAFIEALEAGGLSAGYRANLIHKVRDFAAQHGDWRLALFERPEIVRDVVAWRDQWVGTPKAADDAITAVSRLFQFARSQGLTKADPTADIARLYRGGERSDVIWKPEHLDYARKHSTPAFADLLEWAAHVGLREGDLIRAPESALGAHSLALRTSKRKRLAVIPLTDDAKTILTRLRARKAHFAAKAARRSIPPVLATTIAVNERGRPWSKSAIASAMRRLKAKAATDPKAPAGLLDLHFHDLRGNACTNFRKAGYRAARIALIMSWSEKRVTEMLAIYCSGDDLAADMLAELERDTPGEATPGTTIGAKRPTSAAAAE